MGKKIDSEIARQESPQQEPQTNGIPADVIGPVPARISRATDEPDDIEEYLDSLGLTDKRITTQTGPIVRLGWDISANKNVSSHSW